MANKFLLIALFLTSCRSSSWQRVELNYDNHSVTIENDMFFVDRIKIFSDIGNTLYELKLKDNVGVSKVFLFQNSGHYKEEGSLQSVRNESGKIFIQVEIHSRDKQKIEMFESPFDLKKQGEQVIDPIKEPFP